MDTNFFEKPFHQTLTSELNDFTAKQKLKFPEEEVLKMDMHCHDYNSNVPDELLGRILKVPETWLPTEQLLDALRSRNCNAFTITNHNNARSCYEQQEKGIDVLTASEFSCMVPDFKVGIHVLTYGFTPDQEKKLNKLRANVYDFQEYTCEHDIPTIWAHPLYHYTAGVPPYAFFKKMALIFERFEVINGQRDTWQNMLTKAWIESLDEEKIKELIDEVGIDPNRYCRNVYSKSVSAGSDSHMGIFSGLTGSYLHVPNLEQRKKTTSISQLALEAIREGRIAPYGSHSSYEKMSIAFLDYVCQIALYHKDPGLMRIMLHKGSTKEKMLGLFITNAFGELRKHRVTMNFIELFHKCFGGTVPGFSKRWFVPKVYKPVFDEAKKIAEVRKSDDPNIVEAFEQSIFNISNQLNKILSTRLTEKIQKVKNDASWQSFDAQNFIEQFELPSEIRSFLDPAKDPDGQHRTNLDIGKFLDGLSFPFLASGFILAANFTSTKVLYNTRPLLSEFAKRIGKFEHPKRMLWLTDTFEDNNGVSTVLQSVLEEIRSRNLPIDILTCSNTLKSGDHLIVSKPLSEFSPPFYHQQPIRVPNFLEIHRIFLDGEYDRIMCSTEGPMGLVAMYLKNAYSVPAYHYIHTDWMTFIRKVLRFDQSNLSRVKRLLRAYYKNFDALYVLNKDQEKWFTGRNVGFEKSKVHRTAHWIEPDFTPQSISKKQAFGIEEDKKVLLFTGRLSEEKGVLELGKILGKVKQKVDNVEIVFAGNGPAENKLKEVLPQAHFLGWVDRQVLPGLYSAADLFVLPSKFDTFSMATLEALSCGLPVIAFKTKGPKDIIKDGQCGFLVNSKKEMTSRIIKYLLDGDLQKSFRRSALKRARKYTSHKVLAKFLEDLGLS